MDIQKKFEELEATRTEAAHRAAIVSKVFHHLDHVELGLSSLFTPEKAEGIVMGMRRILEQASNEALIVIQEVSAKLRTPRS